MRIYYKETSVALASLPFADEAGDEPLASSSESVGHAPVELVTFVPLRVPDPYGEATGRAVTHWPSERGHTRAGARRDAPLTRKEFPVSVGRAPTVDRHLDEHPLDVGIGILELEVHPSARGADVREGNALDDWRIRVRRNRGATESYEGY